nr:WD repeat containing protein 61 [Hymenolepis microstoma]
MPKPPLLKLKNWFQNCIFPKDENVYFQDVSHTTYHGKENQITRAYERRLEEMIKCLLQNERLRDDEIPNFNSLCTQSWFWGPLSRLESNGLLHNAPDGSFLVRVSENDSSMCTLTFRFSNDTILNNRITQSDCGFGFIQDEAFESIKALIEHAMSQSESGAYCLSNTTFEACATVPENRKVRLLHPYSRFSVVPPLLFLCRYALFKFIRTGAFHLLCLLHLAFLLLLYIQHITFSPQYSRKYTLDKAHNEAIWCCAWRRRASDGKELIITGALDNTLKLWEWNDKELKLSAPLDGHRLGIVSVDINRSGTIAASASLDNQIIFWDLESNKYLSVFEGEPAETWSVAFSPDSRFVATGSNAGTIHMIGVESHKQENSIALEGKFIYCLAYSPDGMRLAAGSISGIVNIVDLRSGAICPLDGHATPVRSVAFSHDGRLLASTADDKLIRIYDTRDGHLVISSLQGHSSWVVSSAFSPDNKHLATASADKTVRIWDISAKAEEHQFTGHEEQVWSVRYNDDGTRLLSVGGDGTAVVYSCP